MYSVCVYIYKKYPPVVPDGNLTDSSLEKHTSDCHLCKYLDLQ